MQANIGYKTPLMPFTQQLFHWGIPLVIGSSYFLLAVQDDLRLAVPMLVGVAAVVTSLLALILYAGERGALQWSPQTIMLVAVGLRIPFLFRPPELSDDLYRYFWDGLRILAGHNPYTMAPVDVRPDSPMPALLANQVNHPDMVTIYPPTAQILFAVGAAIGRGIPGFKGFITGIDLLMCLLILRMLDALRLPSWRAVLYAWHPLPILEIAGSGHIDGAGMFLALAGLFLLIAPHGKRSAGLPANGFSCHFSLKAAPLLMSGCLFSCAGLVKLFPVIFLPGYLMLLPRRGKRVFWIGLLGAGILLTAVFSPDIQNGLTTLGAYGRSWEFSGFIYHMLRGESLSGESVRWLISAVFVLISGSIYRNHRMRKDQSAGGKDLADGNRQASHSVNFKGRTDGVSSSMLQVLHAFYGISAAFLLLTPTLYPWYALPLAGLLPFAAGPAGLILTWSVFLAYRVLIPYTLLGLWTENAWTPAAIWLPPVVGYLLCGLARKLAKRELPGSAGPNKGPSALPHRNQESPEEDSQGYRGQGR